MLNILIVDDERTLREGLKNFTKEILGDKVKVSLAENGKKALEKLEEKQPQVVFADINLPDFNGLDLVEIMKHRHPELAVVMISGYEDFPYTKKAIQLKVEDYLLKPVPKTDLKKVLLELYQRFEGTFQGPEKEKMTGTYDLTGVLKYLETNYSDKNLSLKQVAARFFLTGNYLSKQMKKEVGYSFVEYVMNLRVKKAQELLKQEENLYSIQEIASKVGYEDAHYFSRVFKKLTGKSPLQYQKEETTHP